MENGSGESQGAHLGNTTTAYIEQLAVVSRQSAEGSLKILFFCIERLNIPLRQTDPMFCVMDQGVWGLLSNLQPSLYVDVLGENSHERSELMV